MDQIQEKVTEYLCCYRNAWKDVRGLKALLSDCIPENNAFRNTIVIAFEEGIFGALEESKEIKRTIFKYKKILIDDYAISDSMAIWTVDTWHKVVCKIHENDEKKIKDYDAVNLELSTDLKEKDEKLDRMKLGLIDS